MGVNTGPIAKEPGASSRSFIDLLGNLYPQIPQSTQITKELSLGERVCRPKPVADLYSERAATVAPTPGQDDQLYVGRPHYVV